MLLNIFKFHRDIILSSAITSLWKVSYLQQRQPIFYVLLVCHSNWLIRPRQWNMVIPVEQLSWILGLLAYHRLKLFSRQLSTLTHFCFHQLFQVKIQGLKLMIPYHHLNTTHENKMTSSFSSLSNNTYMTLAIYKDGIVCEMYLSHHQSLVQE